MSVFSLQLKINQSTNKYFFPVKNKPVSGKNTFIPVTKNLSAETFFFIPVRNKPVILQKHTTKNFAFKNDKEILPP